jgi:hypothetical protein
VTAAGPATGAPGARHARLALSTTAVLLLGAAGAAAAAGKTDSVVLVNGDRITGEIKGMSRGQLDYKTDDAGRLSIEWMKVVEVTSPQRFELETTDGRRCYSPLVPPEGGVKGALRLDDGDTLPIPDVVSIVPVANALLSRLQAYFDLGVTVAKSNAARTLTADGFVQYRGERAGGSFAFDAYGQDTATTSAVNRDALKLTGDLYLGRWTPQLWAGAEKNDELNLQLRLSVGAGTAYAAIRTNSMELSAQAGLSGLRETYAGSAPSLSLTGYAAVTWNAFRYDSPRLDTAIALAAYPYLTDLGRTRLEGSLRVKYELFSDFNVGLSLSDTWDSRPPDPTAGKNDYLLAMTIGWSYRR